jgi:hypothetical protein
VHEIAPGSNDDCEVELQIQCRTTVTGSRPETAEIATE